MKYWLLLVALVTPSLTFAEDVTNAFAKCAVTKEDKTRLTCYDKIRDDIVRVNASNKEPDKSGYLAMSLVDLKTDLKTLRGKKVSVRAQIQSVGDMQMLKGDPFDMNPVSAESEKLPREDRKKLANGCQINMCSGIFYGTIKSLPLGLGLSIEQINWN